MDRGTKILGLLAWAALCFAGVSAQAENRISVNGRERPAYREGEVIVKYKDDAIRTLNTAEAMYRRVGVLDVKRLHGVLQGFEHLTIDQRSLTVEQAVDELSRDPAVEYAEPNYLIYALEGESTEVREQAQPCFIPGIPYPPGCESRQPSAPDVSSSVAGKGGRPSIRPSPGDVPYAPDPSLSQTWGMGRIGASLAWARQRGSRNVIVAVIDSGVDYNHPDLAANMWRNRGAGRLQSTGVDVEGFGISGDLVGWDFVHNDNLPYDDNRHGTHVAGTIGAVGGNGRGVSGVSQRVSIMAVKFLDSSGSGDTANAIKAIDYAISRGAKVLNNSWGGGGGASQALRDAIQRSANRGALFVAAAGNEGSNNDSRPVYPASFGVANMITVAATTATDTLASFSNTGARSVHLAAPGQSIYSTVPGGGYATMSGTSMATPHVAGAAALVWAQFPGASVSEIKRRLMDSGDSLAALRGRTISGRRLNVLRALQR